MIFLIIKGYAGAGKSTLALEYAKKHDSFLIKQDVFLFGMDPGSKKNRRARQPDHQIAFRNLLSCTENCMQSGKDILLEGALAAIIDTDPLDLADFIKLAKKYDYKPILLTLVADDKTRKRRQKKRGHILKPHHDKELIAAASQQRLEIDNHIIDTSKLTIKGSLAAIEAIVAKNLEN